MARLDFEPDFDFPEEIRPRKRRYRKRRKSLKRKLKLSCCFLSLFLIFGVFLVGLAALARTGLVQIPVLSEIFYKHPQPIRTIEIDEDAEADFKIKTSDHSQTLEISEENLTYLLKRSLTRGEDPYFSENIQAVISEEGIEFFGFLLKPFRTNLTMMVRPYASSGRLYLELLSATAGNLSIPPALADWLTKNLLAGILDELNQEIENLGNLEKVELFTGRLVATGKILLNQ